MGLAGHYQSHEWLQWQNSFFTPRIFKASESLSLASVVGVSTCLLSLATGALFVLMDLKADRDEKTSRGTAAEDGSSSHKSY